jgi:hypothetical protein
MPTWEYATLICHHEAGFLSGKNHWTWRGNKIEFIGEVVYTFKRPLPPKS